jgi:hypothetical protein
MKARLWNLTLFVCIAVWPLAACRQEPAAKNETPQPSAVQPPAASEPVAAAPATATDNTQVATGELRDVDLLAKTLTIKNAEGKDQTFSFTDSTEISGGAGTQGLSHQQGNQVTVRYLEQDRNTAVRIEIVPK